MGHSREQNQVLAVKVLVIISNEEIGNILGNGKCTRAK